MDRHWSQIPALLGSIHVHINMVMKRNYIMFLVMLSFKIKTTQAEFIEQWSIPHISTTVWMRIDDESWNQRLRKVKADICSLHCLGLLKAGDSIVLSQLFSLVQSVSVVASMPVSTGTGSTKHTGLLLLTSSIPLKSDSLDGSCILQLFFSSSCSLSTWDSDVVMLACGWCLDGGSSEEITEVAVSPSCPDRSGLVKVLLGCSESEELEETERPAGSHLGCVTQPSKASNCLKSWRNKIFVIYLYNIKWIKCLIETMS